jgi:hypothetical protein
MSSSYLRLSCKSFFHSGFSTNPLYAPVLLPSACQMPDPSSSWPYDPNNIWWGVQLMKLLTMQSSPVSSYVFPLIPPKSISTPTSHTLLYSSLCAKDRVSHPYKRISDEYHCLFSEHGIINRYNFPYFGLFLYNPDGREKNLAKRKTTNTTEGKQKGANKVCNQQRIYSLTK